MSAIGRNRASRRIVVRLTLLALGLAACGAIAYAAASPLRIILDGRPLNEKAVELNGQLFVPLSVVEKMAGVSVTSGDSGEVVEIVTAAAAEPAEPEAAPVLFADGFEDEIRDGWRSSPEDSWITVDGDLVAIEGDGAGRAYILTGDPKWGDYCLDVDMRVGSTGKGAPREIGVLCRAAGEKDYFAFLLTPAQGQAYFRAVRGGKADAPVRPRSVSIKEGDSVHLRVAAQGKQLTAYLNGDPNPVATYGAAATSGAAGLLVDLKDWSDGTEYAFDNFTVTKLAPGAPLPAYPQFKKWESEEQQPDEVGQDTEGEEAPSGGLGGLGGLLGQILQGL
jgi:hypothetical protein